MAETKRVILYRDEFPDDVWEQYCDIVGESSLCYAVELIVSDSYGYYDAYEDDEDDELDEEELERELAI